MPPVWDVADRVQRLLRQDKHNAVDRFDLATAVTRQLRTVVLYALLRGSFTTAATIGDNRRLTAYVLLFPGEARDNTGIKDLNDNVLGYTLNQEFITQRQLAIADIFKTDFFVVGQDYKTALMVTFDQPRAEFDLRLHELDGQLREILLELLPKATKAGAKKLKQVLEADPDYRFDIYYGTTTIAGGTEAQDAILTVFLLLTQALKGAATARYIVKGQALRTRVVKPFGRNAEPDRKSDPRGKEFRSSDFLRASQAAPAIKEFVLRPEKDHDLLLEYNRILADTVWTVAFFRTQNAANRDVVRDVRKKKLIKPERPNVKHTFAAQKELLELWIVVLNLVDFIKDFLAAEFPRTVRDQHDLALAVFDNVRDLNQPVDVKRAEAFLTRDLRLRRIAVLGTASEFQFYSVAADHPQRIFFVMDVRDLGVEVLLLYDLAVARILDGRLTGRRLLEETVRSTDAVTELRRFTHDLVIETFGRYHALLRRSASVRRTDGRKEATLAFRKAVPPLGDIESDVQVLLGGDEVIVAAHPRFAAYAHNIVGDLDQTILGSGAQALRLGMRTAVAISAAARPGERRQHQRAHHQAMKTADESHWLLKNLERLHRRIERLIDMLEANEKKKAHAPRYRARLEQLQLTKLFTRVGHGRPTVLTAKQLDRVLATLRAGRVPRRQDLNTELVDFTGTVIDIDRLCTDAEGLEDAVRTRVGRDNVNVDLPPAKKIPPPKRPR